MSHMEKPNSRPIAASSSGLIPLRLGIDANHQPVVFLHRDSVVCCAEGLQGHSRLQVHVGARSIVALLDVVSGQLLDVNQAGFSEAAWALLSPAPGEMVTFSPSPPLDSMSAVRTRIYGGKLERAQFDAIMQDVVAQRYSDAQLAAFVSACAHPSFSEDETLDLTRAMVGVGNRLHWNSAIVVDKHCVGGIPGNRTTLIAVPIVTALGLVIPKTSSRAITSPSGTADTMEVLAPVSLSLAQMRGVVEREGGCIVWGGAVDLSPADDLLIRIERALDIDGTGQLIASVISKKVAAGATHVVFDIPVGPSAKLRSPLAAQALEGALQRVGTRMGLQVRCLLSDGTQPVGRGIGPALEAHDVLAVLRGAVQAPADLRERGLALAASIIEMGGLAPPGGGLAIATAVLDDGRANAKFEAICAAQGGMRVPGHAKHKHDVVAPHSGMIGSIDNRLIARTAKLAGAPLDPTAGMYLHVRVGDHVDAGDPLFTLHAESRGELAYALAFVKNHMKLIDVMP
ncbi:thymidine phosphorylase family protein [Tahibacter sp.]|uniref:thymidine phosphorylase family protein n=1 Tax=Tahibacter sp. TaxID=2056211 RepID=UPI0031BB58ED